MLEYDYPKIVPTPYPDVDRRMMVKCDYLNHPEVMRLFGYVNFVAHHSAKVFYELMLQSRQGDLPSDLEVLFERGRNRAVIGFWKLASTPYDDWMLMEQEAGGFRMGIQAMADGENIDRVDHDFFLERILDRMEDKRCWIQNVAV